MSVEVSGITIEPQPGVDLGRPAGEAPGGEQEETMEQYAARREAEMRGESPPAPAAKPAEPKPAAATEKSAAATEKEQKEAKESAGAADEDPEKLIEETHPAKKGIAKRMGELATARKEAEAKAEAALKEAADAKAEVERLKAEATKTPVVPDAKDDPAPSRTDFEDPDEYQAAYTAHAARQEIRKANEAATAADKKRQEEQAAKAETDRQARVQEQITALHKSFNERVEKAQAEYPDYKQKVMENDKLILNNHVFFTIEQSELAPHILYHIANNPEEAESLNTMPPIQAAMRIGELQAELRIARKPKLSKAADPIRPLGHRTSPTPKTPDEETMEEYAARREREETEKREARRRRAH